MIKLIIAVACIALGIWIAFNHPDIATVILNYAMMVWDWVVGLVQGALDG
jgi:hypothetical protein